MPDPALYPIYEHFLPVGEVEHPLLIGLGPLAESIIDYLPERLALPKDAGLYRSGTPGTNHPTSRLEQRIAETSCALIIVDAADPLARERAGYWSQRLTDADVYFHTTLILNADAADSEQWLQNLPPPYLQVCQDPSLPDQISVTLALLPMLPFLQTHTRYDVSDLRILLRTGTQAKTTAVRWTYPEQVEPLITHAISLMGLQGITSALLSFNCSHVVPLAEYDEINILIESLLDEDVAWGVLYMPTWDMEDDERTLSITLVSKK